MPATRPAALVCPECGVRGGTHSFYCPKAGLAVALERLAISTCRTCNGTGQFTPLGKPSSVPVACPKCRPRAGEATG